MLYWSWLFVVEGINDGVVKGKKARHLPSPFRKTEDSSRECNLSVMELEDIKKEIAELVQVMTTLLDSNTRIGQVLADAKEELKKAHKDLSSAKDDLSKAKKKIDILQSEIKYLKGKQNASNRHRFGDKGEKNTSGTS